MATPDTEARLLAVGRAGTAAHVERIVRGWRRVDRQDAAREAARQHAGRSLHVYQDEDGTVVLRGRLAPEVGALLLRALDAARETLYQRSRGDGAARSAGDPPAERPTMAQQQADALALLAETALHHELDPGAPGERYQVVVHVDSGRRRAPVPTAGRALVDVPPPVAVPANPVGALRAQHEAAGIRLHARTTCAGWLGEDVGCAIDPLHPLARRDVRR